ncbi:hypothetical protein A2X44_03535 [candidate division CPR3 bacterium GWF2_35_18]|uniref:Aminotransferase, class IV n=1 Tax=candidate division CPR3 bacterium GW2011_GWF2_35_18 TaxID=1618350 RepID=A0A0G0BJE2_UNCC3|nr:MAG: Aminotransferase, class IV [candidate division CPR3 bacterium GW2011_GWF2_35_18]KKP85374.1 MAG: Aminotransferase, class IV [candidate division CPR3 bacterium GW2011_GWE2_35_7]OGB63051.1 MAG: hypothetical protein A2X44_03535 [candidate division CPR3 bacterium GWF2_35_18]OGB63925.1 MAG: hypothetical protein A2250_02670 [candidate division CPR3 bacterium RIFOXYA2_FULL_35_13]OGB76162.1 MAG: hypothetical protein A2476_04535 [candidate division CPR3 bacterium RIFOXYC2_FULL_35_7]OGB78610.1 MA
MIGPNFIFNYRLKPINEANISIDDLNFSYGFGVYETLKIRQGVIFFPEMHVNRLMNSAKIIKLEHSFQEKKILRSLENLQKSNRLVNSNLKIMIIGGEKVEQSNLYIFALNPLFVDDKFYKKGIKVITYYGERIFPQAKTLNMLLSVLSYREAKIQGAYDAVFVNKENFITEGTRTNIFFTDNQNIYTPSKKHVLEGVTKITLEKVAQEAGIKIIEKDLELKDLDKYTGYFLTSTSSKVLPITTINNLTFKIPEIVREMREKYNDFLNNYQKLKLKRRDYK